MPISRLKLTPEGVDVSRLVFGAWRIVNEPLAGNPAQLKNLVSLCLDHGVTTFDHADIYGSYRCEDVFGQVLHPRDRTRIQLISKYGIKLPSPARPSYRLKSYDSSPLHLQVSVEQSLKNLRTDYLDVLLVHRPDPLMDAEALGKAASQLIRSGKLRAFGVSNFTISQFDFLQSRCDFPLVTNQIELSPIAPSALFDGTLDHAQRVGYKPMIWSPLGGGRIWSEQSASGQKLRALLNRLAEEKKASAEAVVIAWLLKHPAGLIPVLGSTHVERLRLLFAAERVTLDRDEWFDILQTAMGQELP